MKKYKEKDDMEEALPFMIVAGLSGMMVIFFFWSKGRGTNVYKKGTIKGQKRS